MLTLFNLHLDRSMAMTLGLYIYLLQEEYAGSGLHPTLSPGKSAVDLAVEAGVC